MDTTSAAKLTISLFTLAIGAAFWFAKLEAKTNATREKYDYLISRIDGLENKIDDFKNLLLQSYFGGSDKPLSRS